MSENTRYLTANLALNALPIVPSFALWGCSLCMVRSWGDPARRWTPLYKVAFFLFAL